MELEKKPYEISIWDDVWNEKGYYEEQKVCNIGSNNMTTPIRAFNPKMVSNINGSNTFTFDLNFRYWDDNLGDFVENPFVSLLYNERKIKVREGTPPNAKWYDLIIKDVTENSEKKVFTYTAKDQYINELSKTGYELVFDDKLENSVDTVNGLAEKVLAGSDWKVAEDSVILQEQQEEPLYKVEPVLNEGNSEGSLETTYSLDVTPINLEGEETSETYVFDIEKDKVYAFYSDIAGRSSKVQILIIKGSIEVDEDNVITNGRNYYIDASWSNNDSEGNSKPSFAREINISTYRGKRYVKQTGLQFDEKINKYVSVYEARKRDEEGNIIVPEVGTIPQWERRYVFSKTKYLNPALIQSSIVNPRALDGLVGWQNRYSYKVPGAENGGSRIKNNSFQASIKEYEKNGEKNFLSYFEKIDSDAKGRELYVNTAITDNLDLFPDGIKAGDRYCLSLRCGYIRDTFTGKLDIDTFKPANPSYTVDGSGFYADAETEEQERSYYNQILVTIAPHEWSSDGYKHYYTNMNSYAVGYAQPPIFDDDDRITFVMTCFKSLSFEDLKDVSKEITLMLAVLGPKRGFCFTDVQFFPYMTDKKGNLLRPGEIPSLDENSQIEKEYYSYNPDDDYTKEEEIRFEVSKNELPFDYKLIIDSSHPYEKKRTLRASKSNRFNLISELCELFECWVKFEVERDNNTGKISLDEEGKPKKWVRFYDYKDIETQNYAGFKYGINLKSINRNIESDVIASKLIVENNSNEFAEDGFCSISRASLNPTGENFLFDFNYYIRKELLDAETITKELDTYYNNLRTKNNERDELIQKSSGLSLSIIKNESQVQSYGLLQTESNKEAEKLKTEVKQISGKEWNHADNMSSKELLIKSKVQAIKYASSRADMYKQLAEKAFQELEQNKDEYKTIQEKLENIANYKQGLHLNFYTKYSRFIQEGSWISEDYTDDNLYYLDAQGTLHASAFPKVNYTIDIIDVSQVEGFENFNFSLGEKTTVEDVEFFGWALDNSGRPYKEEVIISEITTLYDSPEQNKIKVQNYKTDFEDLFQRITTSTQKLEYKTGSYNKASSILNSDGTIKESVLQGSLNNSSVVLSNAADSTVRWDASGIVTWSTADPNQKLIFGNGGIFMVSGKDAAPRLMLSGAGLNADYIRAGKIDTDLIRIMSAGKPAFGWDSRGISAFKFSKTDDGVQYDPFTFIRLDQFGLYGINGGDASFDASEPDNDDGKVGIEKIKKHANFSLTWDGFQIKSTQRQGGYISITEDNDLQVFGKSEIGDLVALVTIGQLDGDGKIFGLRMKNANNQISLEQTNDGKLWLRDSISIGATGSTGALVQIGLLADEQVFNANNGTFIIYKNGRVEAQEGSFRGNISAKTGEIGGFKIENGILYSTENQEASSEENAKIVLDGLTGSLVAKKGFIGGFRISGTTLCSTEGSSAGEEKIRLDGANGTGHFQGEIVAQSGIIGGFLISNNYLEARTGTLVLDGWQGKIQASKGLIGGFQISNNYFESQNYNSLRKGIRLDGQNALIRLGSEQEQEIQLLGLEGKIIVKSKSGSASSVFDSITIDAKTGSMYSYQYGSGLTAGWYIDSNEAIFNNITARGSIKASVFEYGEVQAVGGILLVRPSTRILSQLLTNFQNDFTFKVESAVGFKAGDLCLITPAPGKQVYFIISEIKDEQDHKILECSLQSDYSNIGESNFSGMPIVNLGQPGDIGIGINASTIGGIIEPQSISVFELGKNTQLNTHLILGKIPSEAIYGDMAGSYGLFADNVHLSGSLVTSNKFGYSSGIRTTPREKDKKIISIHFKENNGEILLWAGAIDETAGSIQNANFYVNEKGYLHANGAHFNGSVLSDAIITASEIKTAIITGTGKDPALLIKDAYTGIVFSGEKIIRKGSETLFKIIGKIKTYSVDESTSPESIKSYIDELSSRGFIISGSISKNKLEEIDSFDSSVKETLLEGGIQYWETEYQNKTFFQVAKDNFMIDTSSIELKGKIYTSGSLNLGEYVNGFESQLILSTDGIKKNGNNLLFDENSIVVEIANNAAMSVDPTNLMINKKLTLSQGISYQDDAAYVPVKNSNNEVVGYNLYVY